jgi:hypothetical protein
MMMKATVAVLVSLMIAPVATAFAPSQNAAVSASTTTALLAEPMGIAKFPGFVGKTEWNRLTTEWGTADTGTYIQAA